MSAKPFAVRSATERFYHPELDVLRYFGFLLIFIHHSMPHVPAVYLKMGVAPWLAEALSALGASGAFGVELFFMLSAYLVTELLIRERTLRGRIDLRDFYIRRALRMWPLYFCFLALAWSMQWWVPGQHIGWRALLAFLFLGGNWWIVLVGFPSSVIFPLWAVSVEEQFYLFWPSLVRRLSQRGILIAAGALLAIASIVRWQLEARYHTWESKLWCNTFVQFDAIALGIIMAVLLGGAAPRIGRLPRLALFVGGFACFLLAGSYFQIKGDPLTVRRVLLGYPVAALGAMAILLATLRPGAPYSPAVGECGNRKALASSPATQWLFAALAYLGRISYGLYTFHICGLLLSDYTVSHQDSSLGRYLLRNAVALAAATLMAIASYHLLEAPFLKMKKRFTHVHSR